jgi:hypothetical protein
VSGAPDARHLAARNRVEIAAYAWQSGLAES